MTGRVSEPDSGLVIRQATVKDGKRLWEIARDSGSLDLNSKYYYLLMCRHFGDTSVVAEKDGTVVGFVTSYRPPESPETIFVWQVAVDARARGLGVASKMLMTMIDNNRADVRYLSATVTPSNTASIGLFAAVAKRLGTMGFLRGVFPRGGFPGRRSRAGEAVSHRSLCCMNTDMTGRIDVVVIVSLRKSCGMNQ